MHNGMFHVGVRWPHWLGRKQFVQLGGVQWSVSYRSALTTHNAQCRVKYAECCEGWWLFGCHSDRVLAAQARCPAFDSQRLLAFSLFHLKSSCTPEYKNPGYGATSTSKVIVSTEIQQFWLCITLIPIIVIGRYSFITPKMTSPIMS